MIEIDFGRLFRADFSAAANGFHWAGFVLFLLATVLTVTSGTRYILKYWLDLFPAGGKDE